MHASVLPSIPVETLLMAYRSGIFPMADEREDDEIFWVEPSERAIIPLERFRCSHSLKKILRQDRLTVTLNTDFAQVIAACAQSRADNAGTWISTRIEASYARLHASGGAQSVECWREGQLMGGLYGVTFDRVFCGESMFTRGDNASKVALAWLVALMKKAGYTLLDCQFMTEHLRSLGAEEITQNNYLKLLTAARGEPHMTLSQAYRAVIGEAADGHCPSRGAAPAASSPGKLIAQSLTQTS